MNSLVHSQQQPSPSSTRSYTNAVHMELAKCLQLVVPASMTADDRAGWIAAAADALQDIRPDEIAAVSAEVRRLVTRAAQIVPEIARLVAEHRAKQAKSREYEHMALPAPTEPRRWRGNVLLDNRGKPMSQEETDELNELLAGLNATARYHPDGSRYLVERA